MAAAEEARVEFGRAERMLRMLQESDGSLRDVRRFSWPGHMVACLW
jgi:hypothetical protein